jgi:hypothetical protein
MRGREWRALSLRQDFITKLYLVAAVNMITSIWITLSEYCENAKSMGSKSTWTRTKILCVLEKYHQSVIC